MLLQIIYEQFFLFKIMEQRMTHLSVCVSYCSNQFI